MQLDFLLTNSPQMDSLRPGNMTAGTDRCGASQSRFRKADSEDAGSFDTALESARARHETARPASPDRQIAPAEQETALKHDRAQTQ